MQLHYKGFSATVRYSAATEGFYGEVVNAEAVIAFQSSHLDEVESAFQEAVEHYLVAFRSPVLSQGVMPAEAGIQGIVIVQVGSAISSCHPAA